MSSQGRSSSGDEGGPVLSPPSPPLPRPPPKKKFFFWSLMFFIINDNELKKCKEAELKELKNCSFENPSFSITGAKSL